MGRNIKNSENGDGEMSVVQSQAVGDPSFVQVKQFGFSIIN
jgi:hypothetical protein